MKRLVTLTAIASLALACKPASSEDEIRLALPDVEGVRIKVPGSSGAKPGATAADFKEAEDRAIEALGETAQFYVFTRTVSRGINTGAAFILILVHTIVQFPATSVEGDTTIWGPWTDALNPSEYRLTVRQDADGSYLWSLEGRLKSEGANAIFTPVVSGDAMPGEVKGRGTGTFLIDFDAAERLDPVGNDAQGLLTAAYDLASDPASLTIDFETPVATPDGGTEIAALHYEYREARDGSGDFQFELHADLDDNGSAWEDTAVRSRWKSDGTGRADMTIEGGDAGTTRVSATECWDTSFARVYYTDSVSFQPTEGDAAACAYDQALPPSL